MASVGIFHQVEHLAVRGERGTVRVFLGLVAVLFIACHCNGCKREDAGLSEGLGWEVRRTAGGSVEEARLFDGRMLGRWRITDFLGGGDVYVVDGRIVLEKGDELTGITWDGPIVPIDYEIRLQAMRVEGEDFFCGLTFPVKDDHCSLIVGGWRGKVVGLSNIDLMDAAENETTVLLDFETGRWYDIRLRVTSERIQAWIDDDRIVDVEITGRIIDVRYEVEACRPLGIATWQTTAALRNIIIRKIKS